MGKFFQNCCRLCLDETRNRMEIHTIDSLPEMLDQLYGLKFDSNDKCSKSICIDCYGETKETHKWLKIYEEQKQTIAANQRRFQEEILQQLGPEIASPVPPKVNNQQPTSRAARLTRRSANKNPEPEQLVPVKKERIVTRSTKETDWEPSYAERYSETPSESVSPSEETNDGESSETATSTTDAEFKCPKCEVVFDDMGTLEKHTCEFVCSICSAEMSYRNSLKRHLIAVHKIDAKEWQNYWNPRSNNQSLLVEGARPKKRYRYESDSPTDMEEDSDQAEKTEVSCNYCGDRFDTSMELKAHECDYGCNICGYKFANRTNVKRHKINVHKMDPNDPSLKPPSRPPSRAASRSASKPAKRPVSRAASVAPSEHPSEDEPLSSLNANDEEVEEAYVLGRDRYKYFCMHCDYINKRKPRLITHIVNVHKIPKDQIDVESVQKEELKDNERSKTPVNLNRYHRASSVPRKTPERCKTPIEPGQHRSRSRSTFLDDSDYAKKRKRSLSACSNKSSRMGRSRSVAPSEHATIRRTPADLISQVSVKLRPTVNGIQANRLHVAIQPGCEETLVDQQIQIRATSFVPPEPCSIKKLFKLRTPVRNERQQIDRLRAIFCIPPGGMIRNGTAGVSTPPKNSTQPVPVQQMTLENAQRNSVEGAAPSRELFKQTVGSTEYQVIEVAEPGNLPVTEPMEVDDPNTTREWRGPRRKITKRREMVIVNEPEEIKVKEEAEQSLQELEKQDVASNISKESNGANEVELAENNEADKTTATNEQMGAADENTVDSTSTVQSKEEAQSEATEDFDGTVMEVDPSSSENENDEQDDDLLILPD